MLRELERRKRREGKSLSRLVSELLTRALHTEEAPTAFHWETRPMGARVDLEDKEALRRLLDAS